MQTKTLSSYTMYVLYLY